MNNLDEDKRVSGTATAEEATESGPLQTETGSHSGSELPRIDVVEDGKGKERATATLDDAPAGERIKALFDEMPTRRDILLGILEYAREPRTPEDLQAKVADLEAHNRSVFSSTSYARQLEWAGALKAVDEQGRDFDSTAKKEPEIVEVDGMRYLKPAEPPMKLWVVTEAGSAYLAQDDPAARMASLFEENKRYAPIYQRILTMCRASEGCSVQTINDAVNGDPLLKKPHYFAPHFVEQLEKCRALSFNGSWVTTELGVQGIQMLGQQIAA